MQQRFELTIRAIPGSSDYLVQASSPAGNASGRFTPPPHVLFNAPTVTQKAEAGARLFQMLFSGSIGALYRSAPLPITARIPRTLTGLPWGWLYDPYQRQFLANTLTLEFLDTARLDPGAAQNSAPETIANKPTAATRIRSPRPAPLASIHEAQTVQQPLVQASEQPPTEVVQTAPVQNALPPNRTRQRVSLPSRAAPTTVMPRAQQPQPLPRGAQAPVRKRGSSLARLFWTFAALVLLALLAAIALAFSGVFGYSGLPLAPQTATATGTPTVAVPAVIASATPRPTATPTTTPTPTPEPTKTPTPTPTPSPTRTPTPAPTNTPLPTATQIPVPPSATSTRPPASQPGGAPPGIASPLPSQPPAQPSGGSAPPPPASPGH